MRASKQYLKAKVATLQFEQEPSARNFVRKYAELYKHLNSDKLHFSPSLRGVCYGKLQAAHLIEEYSGNVEEAEEFTQAVWLYLRGDEMAGRCSAFLEWRSKHDN